MCLTVRVLYAHSMQALTYTYTLHMRPPAVHTVTPVARHTLTRHMHCAAASQYGYVSIYTYIYYYTHIYTKLAFSHSRYLCVGETYEYPPLYVCPINQ